MLAFLKTFGRLGGIVTLILLAITLLRQLISLVSFLIAAIKIGVVVAFAGLFLVVALAFVRGRRRREAEEL